MSERIVVLTGAGISKESGLDTFRDADGIWSRVRLEDVATPEAFARDPNLVQAFYNARRHALIDAAIAPNAAHRALAALEERRPGQLLVVTQNIDDLHERAGSRNLIHMHGELLKARCTQCGAVLPWHEDIDGRTPCVACASIGCLRPHVVWFGEMPLEMDRITLALARCEIFIAIGTSGNVYPAAGFVEEAKHMAGARTVELNMEPSAGVDLFDEHLYGPATDIVPRFLEQLEAEYAPGS